MLHSEYTMSCFMAKSVVRHNVTSKQDRHFIVTVLFWTVVLFKHLNANMFFLFVCLSDCKYLLFHCVPDTFLSAQLIYRGKVKLCHQLYDFRGKESKLFFAEVADRENLNPRKIIPMFLRQNRENLATRKYSVIRYIAHHQPHIYWNPIIKGFPPLK